MSDKLSDCPFCRAPASIGKIGRDWWELKAEHDDECALDSDHVLRAPQTPEGRAWIVAAWNRRASPAPAISESNDALLTAARRAILALARAAERNPTFERDYEALSNAIDAATHMGAGGTSD
ncbi:hypothetical protein [Burkholderia gladioli]|uniref:hypothetical protein n=1 Tax=Burkholderia gladioli TaxID=28095 RepID=UPI0016405987|nr:hypothetical protein [Burkholderia gladioli]